MRIEIDQSVIDDAKELLGLDLVQEMENIRQDVLKKEGFLPELIITNNGDIDAS